MSTACRKGRLEHLAGDAYRLFFPLGIIASLWGVMLWPAFYAGWISWYPLEAHTRLMVTGFAGCMIVGFVSTSLPRLTGTSPFGTMELLCHGTLGVAVIVCLTMNYVPVADLLAALWWLAFLGSAASILFVARDVPPPGFPLALAGLLLGSLASLYLGLVGLGWIPSDSTLWMLSRLLLFQGVLWLTIVGVAPFILPRFFGQKSRHGFEESPVPPPGWIPQFVLSLGIGFLVLLSFVAEASGMTSIGLAGRSLIVLAYAIPGLFQRSKPTSLGWAIRTAFLCSVSAWVFAALYPQFRTGVLHFAFLGCGLLILTVAVRVVLGHADRMDRLQGRMRLFHLVTGLVVLTAATRVTADIVPAVRISHFVYAALGWVTLVAVWIWCLRREILAPREEPAPQETSPSPPSPR